MRRIQTHSVTPPLDQRPQRDEIRNLPKTSLEMKNWAMIYFLIRFGHEMLLEKSLLLLFTTKSTPG
jgi:hypothetical protein